MDDNESRVFTGKLFTRIEQLIMNDETKFIVSELSRL
jgi:hypothetical protein